MKQNRNVERDHLVPEYVERRVVEISPRDVRADLDALVAALYRALKLGGGGGRVLQRDGGDAAEFIRVFFGEGGEALVLRGGNLSCHPGFQGIEGHSGDRRENLVVDSHRLHVRKTKLGVHRFPRYAVLGLANLAGSFVLADEGFPIFALLDAQGGRVSSGAKVFHYAFGDDVRVVVDDQDALLFRGGV